MTDVYPLHTTTVRFDADLWTRLGQQARRLGRSRAHLIRAAVREYIVRLELGEHLFPERMKQIAPSQKFSTVADKTSRTDPVVRGDDVACPRRSEAAVLPDRPSRLWLRPRFRTTLGTLAGAALLLSSSGVAHAKPQLYWSNANDVMESNLDGSGARTLVSFPPGRPPTSTWFLNGLTATRSSVFWLNDRSGIGRMTRAGHGARLIIRSKGAKDAFTYPVLAAGNRLYWLTSGDRQDAVVSATFDGREKRTLLSAPGKSLGSLVAFRGDRLIWTTTTTTSPPDAVRERTRTDLVSTDRHGGDRRVLGSLPTAHQDIAAVAVFRNHVYWARLRHHRIYRANLDGRNVRVFARTGAYNPFRLATGAGRVVWAAQRFRRGSVSSVIGSARPDGSGARITHRLPGRPGKPGVIAMVVAP